MTKDESHSHFRNWICDAVVLVIQGDDIEEVCDEERHINHQVFNTIRQEPSLLLYPPCFANAVANQNVDMSRLLIIPKILCVLGQVVRASLSPKRIDRGGLGQSLTGTWKHSARNSVNKVIVVLPLQVHLFTKAARSRFTSCSLYGFNGFTNVAGNTKQSTISCLE